MCHQLTIFDIADLLIFPVEFHTDFVSRDAPADRFRQVTQHACSRLLKGAYIIALQYKRKTQWFEMWLQIVI